MTKTKIVKIKGGLGNQMFQFAFGKAIEKLFDTKVLYDITTHYANESYDVQRRGYCLDIFKLDIDFATEEQSLACIGPKTKIPGFIRNLFHLRKFKNKIDEHGYCKFHPEFLKDFDTVYYEGYFQNEKYFKDIASYIKEQFTFPEFKDEYNKTTYEKIKNCENAVFIHVRRSDYKACDQLDISFYRQAVKYIQERVANPTFFVFGAECPEYIKNEFNIGCEFEFVGEQNTAPENHYEDMRLMTASKHGIMANSSYSWWGAWLGEDSDDRIIIAPTPWLQGKDDVICDNWIKIKNRN